MRDWFIGIAGEEYATAVMWTLGALLLLFVILIVLRIIRGFSQGSLAIGGRNRLPRLAVTESAVVDNNRRLILVRRDDVEHLVLIGGPSDVVVEHGIRVGAESERPDVSPHRATSDATKMEAAARPAPGPRPARDDAPPPGGVTGAEEHKPKSPPAVAAAAAPAHAIQEPRDGRAAPRVRSPDTPHRGQAPHGSTQEAIRSPGRENVPHHEAPADAGQTRTDASSAPAAEPTRAPEPSAAARPPELPGDSAHPPTVAVAEERIRSESPSRGNGDSPLADARIGPAPEIEAPAPARNRNSLESEMSKLLDNLSERERQ